MNDQLRAQVRQRANDRCEYWQMPLSGSVLPRMKRITSVRRSTAARLLWRTSAGPVRGAIGAKGTDIASLVPGTQRLVRLFNPRIDRWDDHFRANAQTLLIESLTDEGRVTAQLLGFNELERVLERQSLIQIGHYPVTRPRPK
jgi:hypothetical protein